MADEFTGGSSSGVVVDGSASYAFDDNTGTKVSLALTSGYVQYDLGNGNEKAINRVRIFHEVVDFTNFIDKLEVRVSNNGSDWKTICECKCGHENTGWHDYSFYNVTAYRYWRFYATSVYPNTKGYLAQIEGHIDNYTINKSSKLIDFGDGSDGAYNNSGNISANKQYTSFTLSNTALIGDKLAITIKVRETFEISAGGLLSGIGRGYAGGIRSSGDGYQGESHLGAGTQSLNANAEGGGGGPHRGAQIGAGGAGGGLAQVGENGEGYSVAIGGEVYGVDALTTLVLGGGAGSGGQAWTDYGGGAQHNGVAGGNGGGAVKIIARKIIIIGTIDCSGNDAAVTLNGDGGNGGGGAGGSIYLQAQKIEVQSTGLIRARGGRNTNNRGGADPQYRGGDGGLGICFTDLLLVDL